MLDKNMIDFLEAQIDFELTGIVKDVISKNKPKDSPHQLNANDKIELIFTPHNDD